jgi:hypothetical protein
VRPGVELLERQRLEVGDVEGLDDAARLEALVGIL